MSGSNSTTLCKLLWSNLSPVSGMIALKGEVGPAVSSTRVGARVARLELAVLALEYKPVWAEMAHVAHPLD